MDQVNDVCRRFLNAEFGETKFIELLGKAISENDLEVEVANALLNMFDQVGQ